MYERNYLQSAKEHKKIFIAVLEDLIKRNIMPKDLHFIPSVDFIFDKFSSEEEKSDFRILDFYLTDKNKAFIIYQHNQKRDFKGVELRYNLSEGEVKYETVTMDWEFRAGDDSFI